MMNLDTEKRRIEYFLCAKPLLPQASRPRRTVCHHAEVLPCGMGNKNPP